MLQYSYTGHKNICTIPVVPERLASVEIALGTALTRAAIAMSRENGSVSITYFRGTCLKKAQLPFTIPKKTDSLQQLL